LATSTGRGCERQWHGAYWAFIQTLNEMIDNQEKRLGVYRNRVPNIVLLALFGVAAIAHAFCRLRERDSTPRQQVARLHYRIPNLRGYLYDIGP
jgi:hypothetical protein